METLQAKVTSKGQVTLPKKLRDSLSIRTGDHIEFSLEEPDLIFLRKTSAPGSSAGCGRKFLEQGRKPVRLKDMENAVAEAAAERFQLSVK